MSAADGEYFQHRECTSVLDALCFRRAYQTLGNVGVAIRQEAAGLIRARRRGLPEGVGVGDPPPVRIKRWESIGVTGINFLLNAMEMVSQQAVLDSMRLFAREVMPQFRSSDDARAPVYTPAALPGFASVGTRRAGVR
jgi:hypothetical protein